MSQRNLISPNEILSSIILSLDYDDTLTVDEFRHELKKIIRKCSQHQHIIVGITTARTIEHDYKLRESGSLYTDLQALLIEEGIALHFITTTHCLYILDQSKPTIKEAIENAALLPICKEATDAYSDYLKYRRDMQSVQRSAPFQLIQEMIDKEREMTKKFLTQIHLTKHTRESLKPLQLLAVVSYFEQHCTSVNKVLHIDDSSAQVDAINQHAQKTLMPWKAIQFTPKLLAADISSFHAHLNDITNEIATSLNLTKPDKPDTIQIPIIRLTDEKYKKWLIKWHTSEFEYYQDLKIWPCLLSKSARKTIFLLADYVGIGFVNSTLTLFSRRHHTTEIEALIYHFFFSREFNKMALPDILRSLKKSLGDKKIKPHGDLAAILNVIKDMTGIDYHHPQIAPKTHTGPTTSSVQ